MKWSPPVLLMRTTDADCSTLQSKVESELSSSVRVTVVESEVYAAMRIPNPPSTLP